VAKLYNEIAGRNLDRLAALSDGVFAFAMTLLMLDLRVPVTDLIHGEGDLWHALVSLAPNLLAYVMSFMTLGIFWVGQQTQLNKLDRSDRDFAWIHLTFLFAVTLLPFSTKLLAAFITYRVALIVYWLNVVALGATLFWSWRHARGRKLVRADAPGGLDDAIVRRIVVAQSLYAFGAALCVVNTFVSIAFILAVQLLYVIGPRFGFLARL
jgi:uncharacterized membrane protein